MIKPYYQDDSGILYCGDCLGILPQLPEKSVDLVVTSPPYEDISGAGYSAKNKDILFFKLYSEFFDEFLLEIYRTLRGQFLLNIKSKTHNKQLRTPHWIEFLEPFQQFKFKSYIIWKYAGSFDSTNARLHLDYEIIYHLSKDDKITVNIDNQDNDPLTSVWYVPHNISERLHPTQMPIELAQKIIKLFSNESDLILDPFIGSGTTAVACKMLNRRWIGIEINPKYCDITIQRLKAIPERLFK